MKLTGKILIRVFALYLIVAIAWINGDGQKRPKQQIKRQTYLESIKLLELRLENVQEKWRKGEIVTVKVYTTNKGKTTVRIPHTVPWYKYQISILKENNQQAPKTPFLEKQLKSGALSFTAQEIKPGETLEEKISLGDLFDMTQKGTYKIVFKRPFFVEGKVQHELISNSITLSVVE
ncbi:MAG TPA: hypothetical protein VNQ79_13225 [Blastocatellia bacterium]|nr:hypothetical protein [Blastocatellia bacterium]